jgi:catechol 2,3-dioxygenase-like lactoylglutathione lyase family enzyme
MAGYELTDIHHVQIAMPPGEEDEGLRFYGELLGLERIPKPDALAPRGGLWFKLGPREVHLGVEEADFHPAYKAHPAFVVTGLDGLRDRLEAAGHRIDEDVQLEGYRRFHVRDPFGNRLELIEPQ